MNGVWYACRIYKGVTRLLGRGSLAKVWKKVEIPLGRFFFSGSVATRIDDKGRFVLPQSMRLGLVEKGSLDFALALGLGGCLAIYRKSDIERIVERFREKQHLGRYQRFFTLFFSTLHMTTCDKLGRVGIPPLLKKTVMLKEEIVVAGVLNRIEIWSRDRYDDQVGPAAAGREPELRDMVEEAFALLGEAHDDGEMSV